MLRVSFVVAALFAIAAPAAYATGNAQSNAGILLIGGDAGANQMNVSIPGSSTFRVSDSSGMTANSGCVDSVANAVDCDPFAVEDVAAFLLAGNDSFTNANLPLPTTVIGGDGNDLINGGPKDDQIEGDLGNDTIDGNDGNDTLTDLSGGSSAGGSDSFYGDNGNDHLDGGVIEDGTGAGGDVLDGGPQTDTLTYARRTQPLTITEDGIANDGQADEGDNVTNIEIMNLGKAGDKVIADASANTLNGFNGNDNLNGGGGNDRLLGGNGNDVLNGSAGADAFSGGAGFDTVTYSNRATPVTVTIGLGANDGVAGEKDNVLDDVEQVIGGSAGDKLTGEDGADTLVGGGGADHLIGLGGDDVLTGGSGPDILAGASGDDVFNARDGAKDHIDCGTGNDHVTVDPIDVVASNCEHVALPGRPH